MAEVASNPELKYLKTESVPSNSMQSLRSIDTSRSGQSLRTSGLNRRKNNQRQRMERNPRMISAVSEVKQRVVSARLIRMKQLQNQLGETQHRIAELTSENRILKSLHKRQDSALSKYENSNAALPQLLHSHEEELRVWQTRCRNLQRMNKDLQLKIKQKDHILLVTTDQNKHLLQLNKDKNLEERERLAERVKDLEQRLLDKDADMKMIARRLQIETKTYKYNLQVEQQKYRELVAKLENSNIDIKDVVEKPRLLKLQNARNKSPNERLHATKSTIHVDHKFKTQLINGSNISDSEHESTINDNKSSTLKVPIETDEDYINSNDEVDLTKNRIDRSDNAGKMPKILDPDESSMSIRNGMNRVRYQQNQQKSHIPKSTATIAANNLVTCYKNSTKIKATSSSNGSELSGDEGDNEFRYSDHPGFEADDDFDYDDENFERVNGHERDLFDHTKHLEELELKMKNSSINDHFMEQFDDDEKTLMPAIPSPLHSAVTIGDHRYHRTNGDAVHKPKFNDRGDNDLDGTKREIHNSGIMRRESLIDKFCDDYVDTQSTFSSTTAVTKIKKLELNNNSYYSPYNNNNNNNSAKTIIPTYTNSNIKQNGNNVGKGTVINGAAASAVISQRHEIDPKKKTKLLAALKAIDGNDSIEK